MNCVKFNQNIKNFINNRMDLDETEEFLAHYEQCKECREELEILYLVEKTLIDIDADANYSYNFDNMLKEFIEENKQKLYKRQLFRTNYNVMWLTAFITTILMIIYFVINM